MRYYPTDECDQKEAHKLSAPNWMLEVLKVNPSYCSWGPHEDYMWKEGDGWNSRVLKNSWHDFGPWQLDEMNEVVNFYFEIGRESKECPTCAGRGYHPDAQWVSESFYRHSSPFTVPTVRETEAKAIMAQFGAAQSPGRLCRGSYPDYATLARYGVAFREFCDEMKVHGSWHDRITQDEVDALIEGGRLNDLTKKWTKENGWQPKEPRPVVTPEMVNAAERKGGLGGHDAINRSILVEARLKRLEMPQNCPQCEGDGSVFTADQPHLNLILWVLHPRKGCSRGVEVKNILRQDLPVIRQWLGEAASRNASRFSRLSGLAA